MKLHANARTCPNSRKLLVKRIEEESWSLMAAAEAAGISERSARKWLGPWASEGGAPRPHRGRGLRGGALPRPARGGPPPRLRRGAARRTRGDRRGLPATRGC